MSFEAAAADCLLVTGRSASFYIIGGRQKNFSLKFIAFARRRR
ncbi:hypothetical protein AWT69_003580 [Pseudomonas putida]|nr:hypothetical protein AWT69_003580 [Pseudomonas putida]